MLSDFLFTKPYEIRFFMVHILLLSIQSSGMVTALSKAA